MDQARSQDSRLGIWLIPGEFELWRERFSVATSFLRLKGRLELGVRPGEALCVTPGSVRVGTLPFRQHAESHDLHDAAVLGDGL